MSRSTPVTDGIPPPGAIGRVATGDIVRRTARRHPARTALIDGDTRLTFAALDTAVNRFAHHLRAQGLQKGDRVASLCHNSWQFVVALFGIQKAGLIWVPINTGLSGDDVHYILEHAETRLVVADDVFYARADLRAPIDALVGRGVLIPVDGAPLTPAPGMVGFAAALAGQPDTEPDAVIEDRDVAQIMYTSGTTGRPKGVMLSHLSVYIASLSNVIEMELRRDDVATCLMPLFHCAQHTFLCAMLHIGAASVITRGFDAAWLLAAVPRERISWVFALPLMYRTLLEHPDRPARDLSSLRYCLYAMTPMAEPLLRRLIAEVCPNFALASGQTEVYPAAVFFRPEEQLRRFGSYWGEPSIINDVAIMDDDGTLLERGRIGEIVNRGPNVLAGYYKNPEATAAVRQFGWHHTGDLGLIDQDGQLLFTDRKKDMIKTGGENVASIKVEEVLLRHPGIANAVVIGLPHPRWIEAVTGFVLLKPGAALSEAAIIEHCRQHLGSFEVPKAVRILDALPMTSTGKVQKQPLRVAWQDLYQ